MSDGYVIAGADGTIAVTPGALTTVVARAADAAPDARVRRSRRGLDVEVEDGRAHVSLHLAVRYGAVVPDVARGVQSRVAEALAGMCGLEVDAVDVAIEELE